MAKSRRNRAKAGQRADPIAKKAVKPLSDPELISIRNNNILPILQKLKSSDPKNRTTAASAVANIVQDTKCRKLLLREQIVHVLLTETLTDASLEGRAAGWEILRVLAAEEEADFSVHLYRVDVLTAIQHASIKIADALISTNTPFIKRTKAEQAFYWSIAEALVELITALAVAQDEALCAISVNPEILQFLFTITSTDCVTASVLKSALSCMITLSEDNQEFVKALLNDSNTDCYKRLANFSSGNGFEAVLACGVLHNIFSVMDWNDQSRGTDGASDAVLVPILSRTLERIGLSNNMADDQGPMGSTDVLQIALEVLASIGTALQNSLGKDNRPSKEAKMEKAEDNDDAMEADNDDDKEATDDDDELDDEMGADMEMVTGPDAVEGAAGIDDLPTLAELIQNAIPQVLRLFRTIKGDDEASSLLRTHTLTALSNIAWTVSCIDFHEGANRAIQQAWTPVAQLVWKETVAPVLASNTSDVGLATIVTSLAWAIARTLPDKSILSGDEHLKFISLYHASKSLDADPEDPFQSLGVKCIGVLGQLALGPAPLPLNREIGVFLVTVVTSLPETPVADAVEALNQLFDIYGDENSANDKEVFWKDNFLQHIEDTVQKVRTMVKQVDKRKSTELRARAEEASLNLSRFIQYKKKHRP
ncbi:hypothetical protein GGR50DRAFT_198870 [Xylaria sp. CBS 124048]|nr:hypothetical protein GGR50DRAFT_198870 [Xylaria sp. CBS 124048]